MCSRSGTDSLGDKADFWLPGFFGFFGSGFELPPLGLGAAGAGPRGVCGELLGEWHGDGAPKVVGTPDTEYGTSSRELEGVDSVVAAKLANALSPSTGWSPPVAAPVVFFQKEEIIT